MRRTENDITFIGHYCADLTEKILVLRDSV
jgi:hypothetical protein